MHNALFPLLLRLDEPFIRKHAQLLDERVLPVDQEVRMVPPYCPLDQFLLRKPQISEYVRILSSESKATHSHGELVIREQPRHEVEEVVVVLAEDDRLERDLRKERLETRWELALDLPVLLRDRLLEHFNSLLELGMERVLVLLSASVGQQR